MAAEKIHYPKTFMRFQQRYPHIFTALNTLGAAVSEESVLDAKVGQLVQLAAAASIRSEGAVHSHVRRAIEAGASADEIRHTIILLVSTIGYPTMAAALSWVDDILDTEMPN